MEVPSILVSKHPGFASMKPRPCDPDHDTVLLAAQGALRRHGASAFQLQSWEMHSYLEGPCRVAKDSSFPIKFFPVKQKPLTKVILLLSAYVRASLVAQL